MFRLAVVASALPSVRADCIDDLVNIAKDFGEAGVALKSIVSDCTGDDRTKCQQDVDQLLQQLTVAVQDVDKSTTSCGSHGPDCVAEIKKLSEAINAIDEPAKKMADECAGQHKSILNCAVDGGQVAVDVVQVGKEISDVVSICKKGIDASIVESTKTDKCCVGKCAGDVNKKYWSIAKGIFGDEHCGECCMDPAKYNLFHFFEKNLTKSESDTPCKDFGYTVYDSTPTHGFGPVSMTLDLYNKPKTSEMQNSEPNGPICDICKEAVNKGIDAGVSACEDLCQKAPGILKDICGQACSKIDEECEETIGCAEKVCGLVKLCSSDGIVV